MSVLRRDIDAYQTALDTYRRHYTSSVNEQNAALQALQAGQQRYLVPTNTPGQYAIATGVDDKGSFSLQTHKTGGFLGMGRKTVPDVVGADYGLPVLPTGPTPEAMGPAPQAPNASMAEARRMQQPSLAEQEAGLIGEVMQGRSVRNDTRFFPPDSVAMAMSKRANAPPPPAAPPVSDPNDPSNNLDNLSSAGY